MFIQLTQQRVVIDSKDNGRNQRVPETFTIKKLWAFAMIVMLILPGKAWDKALPGSHIKVFIPSLPYIYT
ncbi:hypothetical protein, partial [Desulfocicer niacini]